MGCIMDAKLVRTRGACAISGSMSTFKLGVKGSGSRMFLGNADRIKFRIYSATQTDIAFSNTHEHMWH
jgi:hypothetical protein